LERQVWVGGRLGRLVAVDDLVWFVLHGSDVAAGMFVVSCWHFEVDGSFGEVSEIVKVWYYSQRIGRVG
jgi:hypothetical protein